MQPVHGQAKNGQGMRKYRLMTLTLCQFPAIHKEKIHNVKTVQIIFIQVMYSGNG